MKLLKAAYLFVLSLFTLFGVTVVYAQGSLSPPGAPAPTMKTLEQVEPRIDLATVAGSDAYHHVITNSGSYYLSGNLEVTKTSGIFISASNVTLALNGFNITRISGSGGDGVRIDGGMDGATVRNGTLSGFGYGIRCYFSPAYAKGCLFEKLAVSDCSLYGILAGENSRIVDCRAYNNTGSGISTSHGSTISGCTTYNNLGSYGIFGSAGCSITDCTAYNNQGSYGIFGGNGSSITDCAAYNNQGTLGIFGGDGSSITDCTAYNNQTKYGIYGSAGSVLKGCSAVSNDGTGSSSYGIYGLSGSSIQQCTSRSNSNTNSPSTATQGIGIFASSGSTVKDCTVSFNQGDGIRIYGGSMAIGNMCDSNGNGGDGAGVHATSNTRIEGNNVTGNDRGIEVTGTGNTLGGNTANNNASNFEIAVGNSYGDIIDNTGDAGSAPAHSGNGAAAGTISANNNPWANFSQ